MKHLVFGFFELHIHYITSHLGVIQGSKVRVRALASSCFRMKTCTKCEEQSILVGNEQYM